MQLERFVVLGPDQKALTVYYNDTTHRIELDPWKKDETTGYGSKTFMVENNMTNESWALEIYEFDEFHDDAGSKFQLNDDGTISPKVGMHTWGCTILVQACTDAHSYQRKFT